MKNRVIILIALVLLISVFGGLYFYMTPQAEPQPLTFQINQYTTFRVDENGNASVEWIYEVPPSNFADYTRLGIVGGTVGDVPVHGIGVKNAKLLYSTSVRSSYAMYGMEMENVSPDIVGLNEGETFKVTMTWKTPYLAYRYDNKWRIQFQPVDNKSFVQDYINNVKTLQSTLSVISHVYDENCQLNLISKTFFILPSEAKITNENELLSIGTQSIDYGGGTAEKSVTYIQEIEGMPTVTMEGQALIKPQLITITQEEFLEFLQFCPIDYTEIPLTYGFEDSASWATLDMKFGQKREEYSISFDGLEFNVTPYQLLYYSAKKVVILVENSVEPLLSGAPPISVHPPEYENGEWDAFLKTLMKDDYATLARDIRDRIASTGKAPEAINSSIGMIRCRDALFTFLRIISFYHKYGELPDDVVFIPTPMGNLIWDDAEIPANHAYFLLGTQYVITDTPRVNQIVSDIRGMGYSDVEVAEELCEWVCENITYPILPTLGYFTSEEILDMREGKCLDKANLYLALTRTAEIPARMVSGFLIFERLEPPFLEIAGVLPDGRFIVGHAWAEVYLPSEGWVFADPTADRFRICAYENRIYSSVEETWQEVLASYETTYGELI